MRQHRSPFARAAVLALRTSVMAAVFALHTPALAANAPPREGDFAIKDFKFVSGEALPELRVHYVTLGRLARDARGHASNAVLILHGTGGTGRQFLAPQFADELYGAGQPLDTTKYFIVLPDGIGHGHSSRPSDGLRAHFPHYDYDDMIEAQYRLLTKHLGVDHLRLVMGTSMGGMHTWVWAESHPGFMDAAMPLACLPVAIVGRNRLWRDMVEDAILSDPEWKKGDYTSEPTAALRAADHILLLAGSAPLFQQRTLATRDSVDHYLGAYLKRTLPTLDANDLLYQVDASRRYDPSPGLERITTTLVHVNSGDDFINPPELGIAEREIKRVKHGRFVLIPASDQTHGHGTHTWAVFWKQELTALLAATAK